jgi:hypothetical protein
MGGGGRGGEREGLPGSEGQGCRVSRKDCRALMLSWGCKVGRKGIAGINPQLGWSSRDDNNVLRD